MLLQFCSTYRPPLILAFSSNFLNPKPSSHAFFNCSTNQNRSIQCTTYDCIMRMALHISFASRHSLYHATMHALQFAGCLLNRSLVFLDKNSFLNSGQKARSCAITFTSFARSSSTQVSVGHLLSQLIYCNNSKLLYLKSDRTMHILSLLPTICMCMHLPILCGNNATYIEIECQLLIKQADIDRFKI